MTATRDIDASKRNNREFAKYNYPLTPGVHNMVFLFKDYAYQSSQTGFVKTVDAASRTSAAVSLPIPENLVDSYSVKVGPYELGVAGALALDAMTTTGRDAVLNDIRNAIRSADAGDVNLEAITSTFKAAAAFTGRNILDKIPGGGGINAGLDIAAGTTVNPHVALKFDGVDLKQHTFTWTLSPRNEEEATQIRDMIYFIKSRMLPGYKLGGDSSLSRALLTYPNLVEMYFTGIQQSYFYYFKPAMINTFSTDFTPQGLALNKGGKPSIIKMTMTVTEAQIHTRKDIEKLASDNGVNM